MCRAETHLSLVCISGYIETNKHIPSDYMHNLHCFVLQGTSSSNKLSSHFCLNIVLPLFLVRGWPIVILVKLITNLHFKRLVDLFKSPYVREKVPVNDNMPIRVQRILRLGKGTNDDLFPMAGLLNINELGHMLRPRLRNNRAITLSRGNGDIVFCLVNISYSPAGPQGIY